MHAFMSTRKLVNFSGIKQAEDVMYLFQVVESTMVFVIVAMDPMSGYHAKTVRIAIAITRWYTIHHSIQLFNLFYS